MRVAEDLRDRRAPACVYVLWHASCADAPQLAAAIFDWFFAPEHDLSIGVLGIPVYFRYQPDENGEILDIDVDDADLNFIVPLVDDNMVADPRWRRYLDGLVRAPDGGPRRPDVAVYPVVLSTSAFRLTSLSHLNFLRLERKDDPVDGVPRLRRRQHRLRRYLTQACSRHLHHRIESEGRADVVGQGPPLTVFLSHAKTDGERVAARLRDAIASHSQLASFFDESDIPHGSAFGRVLDEALGGPAMVGMIAVVSDAYAERPWCRHELRQARRPLPEGDVAECVRWFVRPVVALGALRRRTRGMPELANTPVVRWHEDVHGVDDEACHEIVDLLLRESLHIAHRRLLLGKLEPSMEEGEIGIAWEPDAYTLSELRGERGGTPPTAIVHPGLSLALSDQRALERVSGARLRTYADVMADADPASQLAAVEGAPIVGLSFGDASDLGALGLSRPHVHMEVIALANALMRAGCRVGFGGVFQQRDSFLEQLVLLASRFDEEPRRARLVNYQAWPYHRSLDVQTVASFHGVCDFVRIDAEETLPSADDDPVDRAYLTALALTRMRRVQCESLGDLAGVQTSAGELEPTACRIVTTGKVRGSAGVMPGIAEEVLASLRAMEATESPHRVLYVVGGLGGMAKVLADYLSGARDDLSALDSTTSREDPPLAAVLQGYQRWHPQGAAAVEREWSELRERLRALREAPEVGGIAASPGSTIEIRDGAVTWVSPPSIRRLAGRVTVALASREGP